MGGGAFLESWCILSVGSAIAQLVCVRIRVTPTSPLQCSYAEIASEISHILCISCCLILHRSRLVVAFTVGTEHFPSKIHNALSFSSFHPLATLFHCRHLQMTLLIFQVVDAFVVIFSRQTKISCYWLWSPWQGTAQGGAGASAAHFYWVSFLSSLVFLPLKKFVSPSAFLSQGWLSNKKKNFFLNRYAAHPNEHWLPWRFLGRPCIYS